MAPGNSNGRELKEENEMKHSKGLRAAARTATCLLALSVLLASGRLATPVQAQGMSTTTVQGTMYLANGRAGSGTLVLRWPAFTTAAGQAVAADSMTVQIPTDGFVSVNLAPNQGSTPAGEYYTAVFDLSDGSTSTEYWVVPAAATATLAQVRAQVMPAAQAVQAVNKAYVDQAVAQLSQASVTASGGNMTGPLYLNGDPTQSLQAADKHYVDSAVSAAGQGSLPISGGTLSGSLNGTSATFSGAISANGPISGPGTGLIGTATGLTAGTATHALNLPADFASQSTAAPSAGQFTSLTASSSVAVGATVDVQSGTLAAAEAMLSSGGTLDVKGSLTVSANHTTPANVAIKVEQGGSLSVSPGATLTIAGPFEAGRYQTFTGSGTVTFSNTDVTLYPEWFGAQANNVNDDAPALQATFNALPANGGAVELAASTYLAKELTDIAGTGSGIQRNNRTLVGKGQASSINCAPTSTIATCLRVMNGSRASLRDFHVTGNSNTTYNIEVTTLPNSTEGVEMRNLILDGAVHGVGIGPDTANDVAHVNLYNVIVAGASSQGFVIGNGTQGNVLDNNCFGCVVDYSGGGVLIQGGGFSWYGGAMDANTATDFEETTPPDQPIVISGHRSEGSPQFWMSYGGIGGSPIGSVSIDSVTWHQCTSSCTPATYAISHSYSASISVSNSMFVAPPGQTVQFGWGNNSTNPTPVHLFNTGWTNTNIAGELQGWQANAAILLDSTNDYYADQSGVMQKGSGTSFHPPLAGPIVGYASPVNGNQIIVYGAGAYSGDNLTVMNAGASGTWLTTNNSKPIYFFPAGGADFSGHLYIDTSGNLSADGSLTATGGVKIATGAMLTGNHGNAASVQHSDNSGTSGNLAAFDANGNVTNGPMPPTGSIVGTSDTQALTNKTVDGVSPTTLGYLDATSSVQMQLNGKAATTVTVNGHALSSNVVVSASDLTTGMLPHTQLPALVSGDIPSNAANTSGTAAGLSGTPNIAVGTVTAGAVTSSGIITGANDTTRTTSTTMTSSWTTTGLVLPTVPINTIKSGRCVIYWQMSSTSYTVTFGLGMNNAPTSVWGGSQLTYAATGTTNWLAFTQTGTSTTAISTATTAGATGTTYKAEIDFVVQTGASNSVAMTIYGETSNSGATLTIEPGSTCYWLP
jgi:hypothetical protein